MVAPPASEVNAIVEGRLLPVPSSASPPGAIVVKARSGLVVALKAQTPLEPDGSFRLMAPINRGYLTLWAETSDGQKLSADRSVRLEIGKTVRVDLTLDAPRRPLAPHDHARGVSPAEKGFEPSTSTLAGTNSHALARPRRSRWSG